MTTKNNLNREVGADAEVITSIRLSREAHGRLREIAMAEHRTITQQVRVLVDQLIADHAPKDVAA